MKNPGFRHIIAFIAERNLFVSPGDIVTNQITKTGKSGGIVRPYVYGILNRLKKRGQITSITNPETGFTLWGLPGWVDLNGLPLNSHKPINLAIIERFDLFGVNPKGCSRKSFITRNKGTK